MKFLLFLIFLSTNAIADDEHPEQNYLCVKGEKQIKYMISYRDKDAKTPCKVLEKYQGQKKYVTIAYSERTIDVCEKALQKTLNRCESQGMFCTKRPDRNY